MADTDKRIKVRNLATVQVGGAEPGETALLDPDRVNISALVEAGFVELVNKSDAGKVTPFTVPTLEPLDPSES
jgi:hypothetical protein